MGHTPRWCGQPLWVVGLGRDGTSHGTHEFPSSPSPLGSSVSRKAGKKNLTGTTKFKYEKKKRHEFWSWW